jgi:hypothetical protein
MQTLHRLRRFRDLRAVSLGGRAPRRRRPQSVRMVRIGSGSARLLPLPNLPKPTFAVGLRPAVPVALPGTGPESGAVPRGRQRQRAIRFRLSRERDRLPDRVCRACACPANLGPSWRWSPRIAGSMIARLSAWLHVCLFARWPACPDGSRAACRLPACLFACLAVCLPLPVAGSVGRGHGQLPPLGQDDQTQRRAIRHGGGGLSVGLRHRVRPGGAHARLHRQARGRGLLHSRPR